MNEKQLLENKSFNSRDFIDGKESIVVDDYSSDGHAATALVKRTIYGSFLLFLRYKDTNEEQWITQGSLTDIVGTSNEMFGREDQAEENKPIFRLDGGKLTIDGYQVLKIFGSDSGRWWFVTFSEEVCCVPLPGSESGEEVPVASQQYFGLIRNGDNDSWEFWMDEDLEPLFQSGEIRKYHARELDFFDPSGVEKQQGRNPRIAEYEATLKSLVDEGKYAEAIKYSDANGSIIYKSDADSCTFYSFKIMGVCYSKDIRNSWKKDGYKPTYWMAVGDDFFNKRKYNEAIEAYYKAIKEDENNDKAWYLLGCAYRALGNPYESVEAWDEAISIVSRDANVKKLESDSDSVVSWVERGDIEYNQENWKAAIDSYNNSLSIDSRQQEVWFRKGCAHYQLGNYQEALNAFNKALEINPDDICAANNKGATLFKLKRVEEAKDIFENIADDGIKDDLNMVFIRMNKETLVSQKKGVDTLIFITNEAPPPGQ